LHFFATEVYGADARSEARKFTAVKLTEQNRSFTKIYFFVAEKKSKLKLFVSGGARS
jgi:hypothetical protein